MMRLFCNVADAQSSTIGAKIHGCTESNVSQTFTTLERQLDVRPANRDSSGIELTYAGKHRTAGGHLAEKLETVNGRQKFHSIPETSSLARGNGGGWRSRVKVLWQQIVFHSENAFVSMNRVCPTLCVKLNL